jgi:hypothetical protein
MPYIDPQQLLDEGYIQEVNRQFFHPLGLALCVEVETDGTARIAGVLDYRADLEGMAFADGVLSIDKAAHVLLVQEARMRPRVAALGYWVQPVPIGD